MDYFKKREFLNRYNQFKHRTSLIYFLSGLFLVLAVLILGWFLSVNPDRYFLSQPKAYPIQSFKPNIRYVLAKSDVISGTATPSGYVKVILKEPKIVLRAKADPTGNWLVKIPTKIPEKNYQMQVISFDSKGKNPKVKQVKVKVEDNNVITQSLVYKNILSWSRKFGSIKG